MGPSPFDTIVKPEADGSLSITVYRKPTHTDQYLQWTVTITSQPNSVSSKPSPIGLHSVQQSWATPKEKQHLRKALTKGNYPNGPWTKWRKVPYTQGLCKSIKKICGRYGIQTHFKGGKTIKNLLVSPKDKDPMLNQSGAIYRYQCNNLGCDDEYIGETSRTFGERYKEHLKAPSAIHHHSTITGHTTNHNNFQIIGREGHNLARNIKESIYIRVNNPSLNNNIGKFNLSHIWDRVLLNTKGLTLK